MRAEKILGEKTSVKMLRFTQLLGIALGLSLRNVGVQENVSDGLAALKEKGLAAIDARIAAAAAPPDAPATAQALLDSAEDVLVQWVEARASSVVRRGPCA